MEALSQDVRLGTDTRPVVVTGAFGYLGLALLARLSGRGEVVGVGHPPRVPAPIPLGVRQLEGDLARAEEALVPGAALVHLAGGGGEPACRKDPVLATRTFALGASIVAAAARAAGVRRSVLASTISVYGTFREHGRPFTEDDLIAPDDLYGALKATAEHVFVAHGGGVALRFANIYGAGCGVDLGASGAVERFARAAARGEDLTVFGDGSQRIDLVHVDDAVEAIVRTLDAASPPPVTNVGGGEPVSLLELARMCVRAATALGARPRIVHVPAPPGKTWPDRSLSIALARRALGWRPSVSLERGIEELVALRKRAP